MKRITLLLAILAYTINLQATVHTVKVWDGYLKFVDENFLQDITIQLGDTVEWLPLDQPTMIHTITSTNIPSGAAAFDVVWQAPADTFFRYIPQVTGLYEYECTPHAHLGMIGSITVVDSTVNVETTNPKLSVFPNPTADYISISELTDENSMVLYDITGEEHLIRSNHQGLFDLRHLPDGMYFLRLNIYRRSPETIKIIKVN